MQSPGLDRTILVLGGVVVLGMVLGGAIVGATTWRWIFFVNLPLATVAIALAARLLPAAAPRREARLDGRGLALLSPGLALAVFGLSEVGAAGTVGVRPLAFVAAGVALVGLFVVHARRHAGAALVDVSLFARPGFAAASATTLLLGIALFGALILLPLYYQLVRGESALATGLLLMPQGLGAAVAMPLAGWLTDRYGARAVIPVGIGVALLGTIGL